MKGKFTLWEKIQYRFDNTLSRGVVALIGWLFLVSLLMILVFSVLVVLSGVLPEPAPFLEVFWLSMMRALDPGTVAGDSGGWNFRLAMFGITIGGILLVSVLIGVITSGIEGQIRELRKGRSLVVEQDHTVVLGWGPQVFSIVNELVIANQNQRRGVIVILAQEDKISMEDEIRERVSNRGRTRIVCRTGNPIAQEDLRIASLETAKAIIIPAPEIEDPDTRVIKSILAIINNPDRRSEPFHIVAEIRQSQNLAVAKMVGKEEVELVLADELISRIMVQASLQPGLSIVYTDLLDFAGDEIYFSNEPGLAGLTFGEALMRFEDSAVMGLREPDGSVHVNPPMDTPLTDQTQIVAVSADDDTIRISGKTDFDIDEKWIRSPDYVTVIPVRILILGWNRRAPLIVRELDHYVSKGSRIYVASDSPRAEAQLRQVEDRLENAGVDYVHVDISRRSNLDALEIQAYQHVIILSMLDELGDQQADAGTLVTLLHLRDIAEKNRAAYTITTEMLNVRNRDLASVTRAEDFIVSNKLISLMLTQLSENKGLASVFDDLFSESGSELYLKPSGDYVRPGTEVNFYSVVEAARRKGEVAIGYRLSEEAESAARQYGIRLNPLKSSRIRFEPEDRIIVLAEN